MLDKKVIAIYFEKIRYSILKKLSPFLELSWGKAKNEKSFKIAGLKALELVFCIYYRRVLVIVQFKKMH
jgi:hypothetical protein